MSASASASASDPPALPPALPLIPDPRPGKLFRAPAVVLRVEKVPLAVMFDAVACERAVVRVHHGVAAVLARLSSEWFATVDETHRLFVLGERRKRKTIEVVPSSSTNARAVFRAALSWIVVPMADWFAEPLPPPVIAVASAPPPSPKRAAAPASPSPSASLLQTYWVYLMTNGRGGHYVGSTNDPARRVRQHNGEIRGGAKETRGRGPWTAATHVGPFATRAEALRVEYALKNPGAKNQPLSTEWRSLFERDPTRARIELAQQMRLSVSIVR